MSDERHPAMTLRMMLAEIAPGKAAALWGTPEVIAVMNQHYAETILAAKAEERQVFVDMIEQFGSAKLIKHCRAAIKRGEG